MENSEIGITSIDIWNIQISGQVNIPNKNKSFTIRTTFILLYTSNFQYSLKYYADRYTQILFSYQN